MKNQFIHRDLRIVEPVFSSPLIGLIIDLDSLRKKQLKGSTHPALFSQLKRIFHTLESVCSSRIEGNNTTVAEYIETKIGDVGQVTESIREIQNMERALDLIDSEGKDFAVTRELMCELHTIIVDRLSPPPYGEGDVAPGVYRSIPISIRGSSFSPPSPDDVQWYMDELFDFLAREDERKYDLLKIAAAHHRFVWIHPFSNGNGRMARLLTYLLLIKSGFGVNAGRIVNPAAVFCIDRREYYRRLASADTGTDEGILAWCEYVLSGLKNEIEKIDRLLNYDYLSKELLIPSVKIASERGLLSAKEYRILFTAIEKQVLKASDLANLFKGKLPQEISRQIGRLKDKKLLMPEKSGSRKYLLRFDNNYLLRGIIEILGKKGFLPDQPGGPEDHRTIEMPV